MKKTAVFIALALSQVLKTLGQTASPNAEHIKSLNSYVPGSPESGQLMKYMDYPVNLFTGTPQIEIPIYTLQGDGIAVPISLSYHAGGGVKIDELPGDVGLGWMLNAGGEITREIRGVADEGGSGSSGFYNKPHNMDYYIDLLPNLGTYADYQTWVYAYQGVIDLEPDIFYVSCPGFSGKFVYDDSTAKFICITETMHANITWDDNAETFTIITDNGNKYCFTEKEKSSSRTHTLGPGAGISGWGGQQITSWKLSKIVNANCTDSILLNYVPDNYQYFSPGANITYQSLNGSGRNPINSYSYNDINGRKLSSITGRNYNVQFYDQEGPNAQRQDVSFSPGGSKKPLSKIVIKNSALEVQDIFELHHSYISRPQITGWIPSDVTLKKSLRLDSVSEYGNAVSNAYPLRHTFKYIWEDLPSRLSFSKDFWGYANFNEYEATLAPKLYYENVSYDGADRYSEPSRQTAGMLNEIKLPTGGTVNFEYEPNTTAVPISMAKPAAMLPVGQHIIEGSNVPYHDSSRTFTVNVPHNPELALEDGVLATILISPVNPPPTPPNSSGYAEYGYPYFFLAKTAEPDGSPVGTNGGLPFSRYFYSGNENNVALPSGRYIMTVYEYGFNNNSQSDPNDPYWDQSGNSDVLGIVFSVIYNIPDTTKFNNYMLGGSRVKSIITKDPYGQVVNNRHFRYHHPDTDSSYGIFIGSNISAYVEFWGQYGKSLVRTGNNNIPGRGNTESAVVYPKVIEEVNDNGIVYRTEHNYTRPTIFPLYPNNTWPFAPGADVESSRGSEYLTSVKKYTPNGFTDAKTITRKYDIAGSPNFKTLAGIKSVVNSYESSVATANGYAPQYVVEYPIYVGNRLYLTSDTTITYDLSNSNKGVTEWNDYTYGDYTIKPTIVRTGNSDGTISVQKNWYATDHPEPNSNIDAGLCTQLLNANRLGTVLGTKQYNGSQLLSQQYTYAHFDDKKLLTDSLRQTLFNNNPETEVKVLNYDANANPLTIEMRGGKFRKYIWRTDRNLPLATAVMPSNSFFYFSSFEYEGTPGNAFSGSKAYQLPFYLITPGSFGPTDVYVWATGSSFSVNNAMPVHTGKTKGSWTLYKVHLSGGSNFSITGNVLIDQLVILPQGSQFQGNVYDSSNRISAIVNDQMMTSFFEYDAFGRLKTVRDEQGNILKTSDYQYQGPQ